MPSGHFLEDFDEHKLKWSITGHPALAANLVSYVLSNR